jgi:hypothetical protein
LRFNNSPSEIFVAVRSVAAVDHNFERAFTLVYSFMLVEVTGNHLGAVVHGVNFGNCERIWRMDAVSIRR